EEFDFNDVIQDTLEVIEPEAKRRGVDLNGNLGNGALPMRGDRIHLQQVILNLAMNGMDAMENCAAGRRKMSIQTAVIDDSAFKVLVIDSGTGIPAGKLKEIFNTFYTTKAHGTGLGLSIAREIVKTYHGEIWAENRPAGGAVFCFTLPLSNHKSS